MHKRPSPVSLRGIWAEKLVAQEAEKRGWSIWATRLRLGPLEVDLVLRRGDVVAIVEVRGRRAGGWVAALDSIGKRKLNCLQRAARIYWAETLAENPEIRTLRLDLVAVTFGPETPSIEWIEGAFSLD